MNKQTNYIIVYCNSYVTLLFQKYKRYIWNSKMNIKNSLKHENCKQETLLKHVYIK